jgi:hypothetical protein
MRMIAKAAQGDEQYVIDYFTNLIDGVEYKWIPEHPLQKQIESLQGVGCVKYLRLIDGEYIEDGILTRVFGRNTLDDKLLDKWEHVLNYTSDDCGIIPERMRFYVAKKLEEIELRFEEFRHILHKIIPMCRKCNGWVYYEEIEHIDENVNDGKSFKCVKMLNPNKNRNMFIAIPFDKKLYNLQDSSFDGVDENEPYQFD